MSAFWKFYIDTGGTFTDCIGISPEGKQFHTKVLSSSKLRGQITDTINETTFAISWQWNIPDDFIKGFFLNGPETDYKVCSFDHENSVMVLDRPAGHLQPGSSFEVQSPEEAPLLGIRLITSCSLNNPLPPIQLRLATTRATNALLEMKGARTLFCVTKGFKDLLRIRYQQRPDLFSLKIQKPEPLYSHVIEIDERIDAGGNVINDLQKKRLKTQLEKHQLKEFDAIAICLMNSYKNSVHECLLNDVLEQTSDNYIAVSHRLSNRAGFVSRAETTVVNAYLTPIMESYLSNIQSKISGDNIYLLNSAGGLSTPESFEPKDSLLSGPAGGVVGASTVGCVAGFKDLISFDMGGTSTDVARYDSNYIYQHEYRVGKANLSASALSIETVAAGGGSICSFDGYTLKVGPDSAGANPGPACYGAGGPFTITDVNILLGRIQTSNFSIPLSVERAQKKLDDIFAHMKQQGRAPEQKEDILTGFLSIANERMSEAINKISTRKGFDPSDYALVAFGGAGGQHACAVADLLNISTIIFPLDAGLLSAYGLQHARLEKIEEQQLLMPLEKAVGQIKEGLNKLIQKAKKALVIQGLPEEKMEVQKKFIYARFKGQHSTLELTCDNELPDIRDAFKQAYKKQYGHWIEDREIEIESIRVVVSETADESPPASYEHQKYRPEPDDSSNTWMDDQFSNIPVYSTERLNASAVIDGPALLLDPNSTLVIEEGWRLIMTNRFIFQLQKAEKYRPLKKSNEIVSPVSLELFTNRFTAVAKEMGEMLKRTAISVNIRQRLDYSCALLNARGELIVNAPHIPVHLGALGSCVRALMDHFTFEPGDVVITNHPAFGGSHLPDITVVTPVFWCNTTLVGFAASRAHHAELGGQKPGSMPPDATSLRQEGVVIPPIRLVKKGEANWERIHQILTNAPYPSRAPQENIADIEAAVAANRKGVNDLQALCKKFGKNNIVKHMEGLKNYTGDKMRNKLSHFEGKSLNSEEKLDDGYLLKAAIKFHDGQMKIDFTGTSSQHPGNLNATPAIVNSVVMYVLRILLDENLPLNEGLLEPVELILPDSLLNPAFKKNNSDGPAIVGGNTEVSQRLTDMLLKPLKLMACSQGTMNNVLFGNGHFGYYETIGGGTGAGPDFNGADGVHHHMSNTRGTDPETLERRYPVLLHQYRLREKSGGKGTFNGGNGIIREMEFIQPVSLSVLTQHRVEAPYGLQGGQNGKKGEQYLIRNNGSTVKLHSIDGVEIRPGDRFIIKTPGGGGWGQSN